MRARHLTSAVLLVLVVSAAATAQQSTLQLFRSVQRQVLQYEHFTIFDSVNARIDGSQVTLLGKVTMPFKREDLEKRVSRVRGVTRVNNQIEVLPASKSDDELRRAIANAIYSHPTLSLYANQVHPPIHILVERGRVTLEGVVNNDLDRTVAYTIASSFPAFGVTNALKTDAEVKAELEKL